MLVFFLRRSFVVVAGDLGYGGVRFEPKYISSNAREIAALVFAAGSSGGLVCVGLFFGFLVRRLVRRS